MGVRLPIEYKNYLINVGAGEYTGSHVSLLEEWCQPRSEEEMPAGFLAQPFPHRERWIDLSLADKGKGWESDYYGELLYRGSMRIVNVGCESYYLLVVCGDEYGTVWADKRASEGAGIFPLWSRSGKHLSIGEYLQRPQTAMFMP